MERLPPRPRILPACRMGLAAREYLAPGADAVIGSLHSVFRRVVNVRLTNRRFVSFTALDVPLAPGNVATDPSPAGGWPEYGLSPGRPVVRDRRGVALSADLVVSLDGAELFLPRIDGALEVRPERVPAALELAARRGGRRAGDLAGTGFGELLPFIEALFTPAAGPPPLRDTFCQAAYARMSGLVEAIRAGDAGAAGQQAQGLLGLGPGLTPAGDDALAGLMVALALTAKPLGFSEYVLRVVNPALTTALAGSTTELSEDFLRHAARGWGTASVEDVVADILSGEEDGLREATDRLCATGASSGIDQLWGILVGVRLGLALAVERGPAGSGDDPRPGVTRQQPGQGG